MAVSSAKLTEKFQITIPAEVRRRLGLKAGDLVYLTVEGNQAVLRNAKDGWTEAYRGLGATVWKEAGGAAAIEKERASWE